MSVQDEIDNVRKHIYSDSFNMSIGELIYLYKDNQIDIHPQLQKIHRWSADQKSKLIESIMLNIPIPPIYVNTNHDGVWDVIDGVQRLTTIFEFVGIYRDFDHNTADPLKLVATKYLPSIKDMQWHNPQDSTLSFTSDLQLLFKRYSLKIIVMKKASDPEAKYELFERLNFGSARLSAQKVRSRLMIMRNKKLFEFITSKLLENDDFKETTSLTEPLEEQMYHAELVIRMLLPNLLDLDYTNTGIDLGEFLNHYTTELSKKDDLDYRSIESRFNETFKLLNNTLKESAFKQYQYNSFKDPFLTTAFQAIATGVYANISDILLKDESEQQDFIRAKVIGFYASDDFNRSMRKNVSDIDKFKAMTNFGIAYFKP